MDILDHDSIISAATDGRIGFAGIYFLIDGDEIVYVGQSTFAEQRVKEHIMGGKKKFDKYLILPVEDSDLNDVETQYIRRFLPRYNRSFPVNPLFITMHQVQRELRRMKIKMTREQIDEICDLHDKDLFRIYGEWYDIKQIIGYIKQKPAVEQ